MSRRTGRTELTLRDYVRRKNGVPLGSRGALTNMLRRSLTASSFAGFWRHWNPIFGYYLGKYVYAPLKTVVPAPVSLVLTFVVCGFIHDLVIMAVRQSPAFLFTPWFFFLGVGVVLGNLVKMDLGQYPRGVRAAIHLAYLGGCLLLTLMITPWS